MKPTRPFILTIAALLAVWSFVSPARAGEFEDANRAFAAGRYAESAQGYQTILKTNGYSAAVLFNLGNAQLREGKTGDAILAYRRAGWLAPGDPDIAANLRFAQRQAGLAVDSASWTESTAAFLSPNGWTWLASGVLMALCAGLLGARFSSRHRFGFQWLNTASALVLFASGGALLIRAQQLDEGVLPGKATPALISPFDGAKASFEFPAGQTVSVEKEHGDFCFVRGPGGHSGWVQRTLVSRVVPKTPSS